MRGGARFGDGQVNEIVAVAFGAYVTNDVAAIEKAMQSGLKPRFITRNLAQCMANILSLESWRQLAQGPVLATLDELQSAAIEPKPAAEEQKASPVKRARGAKKPRSVKKVTPKGPSEAGL
jgi:hypothetical protein